MKLLIPLLCLPILFLAATSCAGAKQADRLIQDYVDARQDGKLEPAEIAGLDRDVSDLSESIIPFPPLTGSPWLDLALQVAGVGVAAGGAGVATHKYTMRVRDQLAAAKAPQSNETPA